MTLQQHFSSNIMADVETSFRYYTLSEEDGLDDWQAESLQKISLPTKYRQKITCEKIPAKN